MTCTLQLWPRSQACWQKYYENADIVVDLDGFGKDAEFGAPTAVVMYRLLKGLKTKIDNTKQVRAGRW